VRLVIWLLFILVVPYDQEYNTCSTSCQGILAKVFYLEGRTEIFLEHLGQVFNVGYDSRYNLSEKEILQKSARSNLDPQDYYSPFFNTSLEKIAELVLGVILYNVNMKIEALTIFNDLKNKWADEVNSGKKGIDPVENLILAEALFYFGKLLGRFNKFTDAINVFNLAVRVYDSAFSQFSHNYYFLDNIANMYTETYYNRNLIEIDLEVHSLYMNASNKPELFESANLLLAQAMAEAKEIKTDMIRFSLLAKLYYQQMIYFTMIGNVEEAIASGKECFNFLELTGEYRLLVDCVVELVSLIYKRNNDSYDGECLEFGAYGLEIIWAAGLNYSPIEEDKKVVQQVIAIIKNSFFSMTSVSLKNNFVRQRNILKLIEYEGDTLENNLKEYMKHEKQ
jgi:tetratricopeptide (TPR) repeat protein